MEIISVDSSSDDDDTYLNSVAQLKALRKRVNEPEPSITKNGNSEVKEKKVEQPLAKPQEKKAQKERTKPKKRGQRKEQQNEVDSDLEIVSVEEFTQAIQKPKEPSEKANESSIHNEEENYEINVKVLWRSKDLHRLNIHRRESFQKVYQHFADLEGVTVEKILITRKDVAIRRTDTPASIQLSIIDILEGGVVRNSVDSTRRTEEESETSCKIRVQGASKQSSFVYVMQMDENFRSLARVCAERFEVEEGKLKFLFDGEVVDLEETPESLEIEEEACFDLRITS